MEHHQKRNKLCYLDPCLYIMWWILWRASTLQLKCFYFIFRQPLHLENISHISIYFIFWGSWLINMTSPLLEPFYLTKGFGKEEKWIDQGVYKKGGIIWNSSHWNKKHIETLSNYSLRFGHYITVWSSPCEDWPAWNKFFSVLFTKNPFEMSLAMMKT